MSGHLHLAHSLPEAPAARPAHPIQVVIADDHAMVRRSLRLMLDQEDDVRVVAEAADLPTVAQQVHQHNPHVLVLDLQMPDGSSTEVIRRLRNQVPETEIVVLTMEDSPLFAMRALEAGAVGFVLKERADAELPEAIRMAAAGREYVSPQVACGLDAIRDAADADGLSARETEVLRLLALGYTNAEIADQIHLSRRTVETHRAHIHSKLRMSTRAELVRYALTRHLIGS